MSKLSEILSPKKPILSPIQEEEVPKAKNQNEKYHFFLSNILRGYDTRIKGKEEDILMEKMEIKMFNDIIHQGINVKENKRLLSSLRKQCKESLNTLKLLKNRKELYEKFLENLEKNYLKK